MLKNWDEEDFELLEEIESHAAIEEQKRYELKKLEEESELRLIQDVFEDMSPKNELIDLLKTSAQALTLVELREISATINLLINNKLKQKKKKPRNDRPKLIVDDLF